MDLTPWKIEYDPGWDIHLQYFSKDIQEHIRKKCEQMKQPLQGRGLIHSRYQVEEIDQYRIAYIADQESRTKKICFVGNHKQYEKWYANVIGFHDEDANGGNYTKYLNFISAFSKTPQDLLQ